MSPSKSCASCSVKYNLINLLQLPSPLAPCSISIASHYKSSLTLKNVCWVGAILRGLKSGFLLSHPPDPVENQLVGVQAAAHSLFTWPLRTTPSSLWVPEFSSQKKLSISTFMYNPLTPKLSILPLCFSSVGAQRCNSACQHCGKHKAPAW